MNQSNARANAPYTTLTRAFRCLECNCTKIMHILSILNLDWLQHACDYKECINICEQIEKKWMNWIKLNELNWMNVTWLRGMSRMSGMLILSSRLKDDIFFIYLSCFWTSKNCSNFCNVMSDWDGIWMKI